MIDLRRLQVLRVLADRGTVTAAAAALYVTPSAVSQQIRALGTELGVELLHREGRRVVLTPAALALLRHADALSEQWERARADIASGGTALTGSLRFTGVSSAIAAVMGPAVALLRERHPGVEASVRETESTENFGILLAGGADIAVGFPTATAPPVDDARFEQHVLVDDVQDLLVPRGHPLAAATAVTLRDAAAEPWILEKPGGDTHDVVLSACATAGFTPRIAHQAKEWFAVSSLVAHGLGVCLLPRLVPIPDEHAVVRIPLHGSPRPTRTIVGSVRRGAAGHPLIAAGLTALRDAGRIPDRP
ncbi:DNA-binding transcriptional LysR family regulator [Nocardia transvalensis]|uniref:DNA-binding transcriptional LysR family regulator n=1 Tax=Nocardia transvalensis TaxID=37333 RepID=A0A7W9PKY1_9NOCA|nr:LysR family transcriptional regulator [Nocardia transvalensis]MBB5917519.1 DNA-binding transcriptional LysR family regulator [Nocardia transvalensis]